MLRDYVLRACYMCLCMECNAMRARACRRARNLPALRNHDRVLLLLLGSCTCASSVRPPNRLMLGRPDGAETRGMLGGLLSCRRARSRETGSCVTTTAMCRLGLYTCLIKAINLNCRNQSPASLSPIVQAVETEHRGMTKGF